MKVAYITKNSEETEKLGEEFAKNLKPQDIVFLIGELGSGKTTFTKGVAKGLGIESRVTSPTFVLMRTHRVSNQKSVNRNQKIKTMYHLDLYRLQTEKQSLDIGLSDIFEDPTGVTFIEWPEVGQNIVNKKVWKVTFDCLENDERKITINNF